jgi:hypothetical protein
MKRTISMLFLLAAALILGGCATPNFKPVTNVPPDKALVYLYRKYNYIGSGAAHKIYANQKPITLLYTRNYYPYLTDPGHITFTLKSVLIGEKHLFDFMIPKSTVAEINVESGRTYYLSFDIASHFALTPKYILRDNETSSNEIVKCRLAECLETNLVTK